MVRIVAWKLMSLVSPLISQPLLSLVVAWTSLRSGFACSGTPVLILWHPCAGGAIPSVSFPIPDCVFHHCSMILPALKGLPSLPVQSYWWDRECCPPRGGAQLPWTIKSVSKVHLPVPLWLSALGGRFGVSGGGAQLVWGG